MRRVRLRFLAAPDAERAAAFPAGIDDADVGRPNGTLPMTIGWICFAIAALLSLAALSQRPVHWQTGPYASPSAIAAGAERLANAAFLQFAAGGFFSLFLVLWSVGYIVNAISFLPGKEGQR